MHCHCTFVSNLLIAVWPFFPEQQVSSSGSTPVVWATSWLLWYPSEIKSYNYTQISNSSWLGVDDPECLQLPLGLATHILQDLFWGRTEQSESSLHVWKANVLSRTSVIAVFATNVDGIDYTVNIQTCSTQYLTFLINDFLLLSSAVTYFSWTDNANILAY